MKILALEELLLKNGSVIIHQGIVRVLAVECMKYLLNCLQNLCGTSQKKPMPNTKPGQAVTLILMRMI